MFDDIISVAFFAGVILIAVLYFFQGTRKPSSIPGPDRTSKADGNLTDIHKAGSLHDFLMDIHSQYGPITSFWLGQTFVASIASAELFKEHQNVFDRPRELFKLFEPLLGPKSIQYANKMDGRIRRRNYDEALSHEAVKKYYETFQSMATNLANKWASFGNNEHIALSQHLSLYVLKAVLITLMGDMFNDDEEVLEFKKLHDITWQEMERQLTDVPDEESQRMKSFNYAKDTIFEIVKRTVEYRKGKPPKKGEHLLIDILIEMSADEEILFSDTYVYIVGGFQTTLNVMTWMFYFLATYPDIQDKVVKEIKDVLGDTAVDHTNITDLIYIRQVIDETMRCAVVAPMAARFQDVDSKLGIHKIPKNTPVVHALGVSLQDETVWPQPKRFDPDRFSPENSRNRPALAFKPFGFAGKRICPGYRFAYAEMTVGLVSLLRKFRVNMVEGQVINAVHGLVTHPKEEVWINVEKR